MFATYPFPSCLERSKLFSLSIAGEEVPVYATGDAHFALASWDGEGGPLSVRLRFLQGAPQEADIRPRSAGLPSELEAGTLAFSLDRPRKLAIEAPGLPFCFLWLQPPETGKPDPADPKVLYYRAGEAYDAGEIELEDGQTLYIEGGALVRGCVRAFAKKEVTVAGHGILDGAPYSRAEGTGRTSILFGHCRNVRVRDLTMLRPSGWMILAGASEEVDIRNVKQIGEILCSDGIDVVGSRKVRIEDCFLRNNDDCIAIKACDKGQGNRGPLSDFRRNVEDVEVRRCILANAKGGNALEIGYEVAADRVRGIRFRDCDVISVEGGGAVFSIHHGDRAMIEDILFEDIRIDHCYDRFIDFRILESRYNVDTERGRVRGVTLRGIDWRRTPFNAGSTISLIGGYDARHRIEEVVFEDCRIDGERIEDLEPLELHLRHTDGIRVAHAREPAATA